MIQPSMSAMRPVRGTPIEVRLWGRCKVVGDCWEFQGNTDTGGYGMLHWRGKRWKAHRVAYTLAKGEIAPGLDILHFCDNPPCINPDHLREGTDFDNVRDSYDRGRRSRGVSPGFESYAQRRRNSPTCDNGHGWSEENTGRRKDGSRYCRTCHRAQIRRWRRKNRQPQPSEPDWSLIHDRLVAQPTSGGTVESAIDELRRLFARVRTAEKERDEALLELKQLREKYAQLLRQAGLHDQLAKETEEAGQRDAEQVLEALAEEGRGNGD